MKKIIMCVMTLVIILPTFAQDEAEATAKEAEADWESRYIELSQKYTADLVQRIKELEANAQEAYVKAFRDATGAKEDMQVLSNDIEILRDSVGVSITVQKEMLAQLYALDDIAGTDETQTGILEIQMEMTRIHNDLDEYRVEVLGIVKNQNQIKIAAYLGAAAAVIGVVVSVFFTFSVLSL